jgi:hypothetical protein
MEPGDVALARISYTLQFWIHVKFIRVVLSAVPRVMTFFCVSLQLGSLDRYFHAVHSCFHRIVTLQ